MNGRTDSRPRSLVLLVLLAVFGIACVARLGYWQFVRHDELVALARAQVTVQVEQPAVRGTIYDRTGTVVLATTIQRDRLVAYPAQLADVPAGPASQGSAAPDQSAVRARIVAALVAILALGPDDAATLRRQLDSGAPYAILAHELTPAQSNAVRAGLADKSLIEIALEPESIRIYPLAGGAPNTTLASQLLGFVNRDGVGQYGVESHWQDVLAGSPKVLLTQRDGAGRPAMESAIVEEPGAPGADLTLTIDASLQLKLEQELYAAWVADRAKSVSGVVLDPRTGEVLAEASYPAYDANQYQATAATDPGRFVDPVISAVYEPGSVFKLLTATAALGAGVVKRTTKIADQVTLVLDHGTSSVQNADRLSRGTISFQDGVAWSRNVVMSKVALKLGSTTQRAATALFATWSRLGFGARTGIDLAGEVPGLVRDPALQPWAQIDLANGSFGQGIAVTLMQLATGYGAMVNGGTLPSPHVVKVAGSSDVPVTDRGRVMTANLSAQLVAIMERVVNVVPFYRDRTLIPGYLVGGKTGTAQIWDSKSGRWRSDVYNFSFIGFVGRTAPELVVAVQINQGRPSVNQPGNLILPVESFELFRRIATDSMSTLGLPPVAAAATASPSPSARP